MFFKSKNNNNIIDINNITIQISKPEAKHKPLQLKKIVIEVNVLSIQIKYPFSPLYVNASKRMLVHASTNGHIFSPHSRYHVIIFFQHAQDLKNTTKRQKERRGLTLKQQKFHYHCHFS